MNREGSDESDPQDGELNGERLADRKDKQEPDTEQQGE
jgi:hypothetical protein